VLKVLTAVLLGVVLTFGGASTAAFAGMGMQIVVTMPSGDTILLDVESSDSIENVRQKVQDQTLILPSEQLLTFGGTVLEDGRTIADYNIPPGSSMTLGYMRQLALVTPTFPPFRLDVDYTTRIDASPAFSPLTFALTAGAIPAGVSFDSATGTFAGRPATSGAYAFTITVTRDDGTTLAIPFAGTIAALPIAAAPADTLAETGVDPIVPLGLAVVLIVVGVSSLLRRPRRA